MAANTKDSVLIASLVLSVVSLVLLFGVTWYFQSSLSLLQQQVKYDRELLVKLQDQVKTHYATDITTEAHDIKRRQSDDPCQCKDGLPGPRGPPGEKGSMGRDGTKGDTGPRGDSGDRGPRGVLGDQGYPGIQGGKGKQGEKGETGNEGSKGQQGSNGLKGQKGELGQKGDVGPRGNPGDRGPRGLIGDQGPAGSPGEKGKTGKKGPIGQPGNDGSKGIQGSPGRGEKGEPGSRGPKGEIGHQGMKGEKGSSGLPGPTGLKSPQGAKGQKGTKGDKEERNGGTVYTRWGHDQCPSTAELVYSGRVGGAWYNHKGGGSNPQCLPLSPQYLRTRSGSQAISVATMHGGEYDFWEHGSISSSKTLDVPCAVCYVSQRSTVYMVPAKYTCPSGWTREYYGYLMTEKFDHNRSQFTCIDNTLKSVTGSSGSKYGLLFYFVEGRCGTLPCPPYEETKELTCAVCTK